MSEIFFDIVIHFAKCLLLALMFSLFDESAVVQCILVYYFIVVISSLLRFVFRDQILEKLIILLCSLTYEG